MGASENSAYDLAARLRELMEMELSENVDVKLWYSRAQQFDEFLDSQPTACEHMVEEVWHYLSDLDVRLKEPQYAAIQRDFINNFISGLNTAVAPDRKG